MMVFPRDSYVGTDGERPDDFERTPVAVKEQPMASKNDYASNTTGLPKTDFVYMKEMAHEIVDRRFNNRSIQMRVLTGPGTEVGGVMLMVCQQLEEMLASVNYNAFNDPYPKSELTRWLEDMIVSLSTVYLMRARVRGLDIGLEDVTILYEQVANASEDMKALLSSLVDLAESKDREYGASWCKRGGIGAWFTTVRKFDRLVTQLKQKGNDIWNVSEPVSSTESLEETIKDGINYLMLILEKRKVIATTNGARS
jgi:hypothetical protein